MAQDAPVRLEDEVNRLRRDLEAQRERHEALVAELEKLREAERAETSVAPEAEPPTGRLGEQITAGWDRGFYLKSPDDYFRLNIGGWIQPRYEFRQHSDDEDTSSFYLRRVRLDLQGYIFTEALTFRIMPELARTANLRDAWINYAFHPSAQVRFGQFTVPFQWHRAVSPRRQHFAERGVPSETLGWPVGRDAGVMLHGTGPERRWNYGVGLFDGAGRNVQFSNSDGHMASGRVAYALLGQIPREESDYAFSEELALAVGAGLQGAWRNEVRAWDLGRSAIGNDRADFLASTFDSRFSWRGFSLAGDVYYRRVDPDDPAVSSYNGRGYMLSSGYFVVPKQHEVVARYSQLRLDRSDRDTREREWGLGWNIYHGGHDWKTRFNLLRHTASDQRRTTFLIEHHLQF
jgi:phosphate-selective porin OprO and OprP